MTPRCIVGERIKIAAESAMFRRAIKGHRYDLAKRESGTDSEKDDAREGGTKLCVAEHEYNIPRSSPRRPDVAAVIPERLRKAKSSCYYLFMR